MLWDMLMHYVEQGILKLLPSHLVKFLFAFWMKATLNSKSVNLILSCMKTESKKKKRRRKKPAKKNETKRGKFFKAKEKLI